MEFRKATQEDLDYVRSNPFESAVKGYPRVGIPDDNCYTGIHGSVILGVFGLQVKWDGVGVFWLMMASDFRSHISDVRSLLIIHRKMDNLIKKNNLHRAEAAIRTDFPQAILMVEGLGFKRECKMEQYGPNKADFYLYSKVSK